MNEERLKIAVVGAGAMGSLFGGKLSEGGSEVTLVDVAEAHVAAIRAYGLLLEAAGGSRRIPLPIIYPDEATEPVDLVLLFTKTHQTRQALKDARRLVGSQTRILSLQNGLGNIEIISELVHPSRIIIGVTNYPAVLTVPGQVASHGTGQVSFASVDGDDAAFLERVSDAFRLGKLNATVDRDVMAAIWRKVAFNAALNPVTALGRCTVGDVGRNPAARILAHRIVGEVGAVASAEGINFDIAATSAMVNDALDHHLSHRPSMAQDVAAGRKTEIDSICGSIVGKAEKAGLEVPALRTVWALVSLIDSVAAQKRQ